MDRSSPGASRFSVGIKWSSICWAFCFLFLLIFTLKPVAPKGIYGIYSTVGYALTVLMAVLCFLRVIRSKLDIRRAEILLTAAYVFWLFASRMLNIFADYSPERLRANLDLTLVLDMTVCLCVLIAAMQLGDDQRRSLVKAAAVLCAAFAFLISAAGLFVVLTGASLSLPPEFACFSAEKGHLTILSNNWNISMVWVYLGLCMSAYLFAASKSVLRRVLLAAAMLLEFVVICIGSSRTVQFVLFMSVAMLAMLAVLRAMRGKRAALIVPALCAAAAVGAALSFFACGKVQVLVSAAANKTTPAFSAYYHGHEAALGSAYFHLTEDKESTKEAAKPESSAPPAAKGSASFVDKRDLLNDMKTFTERKFIWMSAVDSIKERPAILLMGSARDELMDLPNKYARSLYGIKRDHEHMHNFLVQTLMLSGLPGMLLAAAFCLLLVVRMIKLFFNSGVAGSTRVLLIPPTGLLVQGLFEAGLFTSIEMRGVYFFFLAGVILSEYSDAKEKRVSP